MTSFGQNLALSTVDPTSSPRVSTADQDDGPRPARPHPDRFSSWRSARSSRRDLRLTSSSRIKHNDSTDTNSYVSRPDEKDTQALAISFHQRRKGYKHPDHDSLVRSDDRIDRLMSYCYYRVMNTRHIRTHQSTTPLHKSLKKIELTMRDQRFSGEDLVLVFDFLTRVVEEADSLGMNEVNSLFAFNISSPRTLSSISVLLQATGAQLDWFVGRTPSNI